MQFIERETRGRVWARQSEKESGARECRDDCLGNGPAENAIDLAPSSSLLLKVYAERKKSKMKRWRRGSQRLARHRGGQAVKRRVLPAVAVCFLGTRGVWAIAAAHSHPLAHTDTHVHAQTRAQLRHAACRAGESETHNSLTDLPASLHATCTCNMQQGSLCKPMQVCPLAGCTHLLR